MNPPIRKSPSGPRALIGEGTVIAWRPDGSGDATTFDDVVQIIAENDIQMMVDVVPSVVPYKIPARSSPYDLNFGGFSSRLESPIVIVDVEDGARLKSLTTVSGSVQLDFHPSSGDALVYNKVPSAPSVLALQRNGAINNQGSVPLITANPNSGGPDVVIASFENGNIRDGTAPVLGLTAGATALFEVIGSFNTGAAVPSSLFSGPASATVLILHDGTLIFPFAAQPAFAGNLVNVPLGCSPSGGPTTMRPIGLGPLSVGVSYFDQGLAPPRPIWWDGTQWVDATGTPV